MSMNWDSYQPNLSSLVANRYKILSRLQHSQSAYVYEAHDPHYDRRAILKFPTEATSYLKGLSQEIGALRSLNHPNVVAFYDNGTDPAYGDFLAMEFATGENLEHFQEPGSVTEPELLEITRQTLEALAYLHEVRRIIHLDVKPANLIFDREQNLLRLVDFGLARRLNSAGTVYLEAGFGYSPNYLAPELARAILQRQALEVKPTVDIYALGIALHELLTGKPFYGFRQEKEWLKYQAHNTKIPALLGKIPPLEELIRAMLEPDPDLRPGASQLLEALNHFYRNKVNLKPFELNLTGREREIAFLEQYLKKCAAGSGDLLVIGGKAGIGKSRLAEELLKQAQSNQFWVAQTRLTGQDVRPYSPLLRLVRACFDQAGIRPEAPEAQALVELLPGLSYSAEAAELSEDDTAPEGQSRLSVALLLLFQRLSQTQPILLYLDDAQNYDSALLGVLQKLRLSLERLRVLICLTFRNEDARQERRLEEFFGKADLTLEPLGQPEIRRLLAQAFGVGESSSTVEQLALRLEQQTGGRPFYLEAYLRGLLKKYQESGATMAELVLRENLQLSNRQMQTMSDRISLLDLPEREVVRVAALLGFDFELTLIETVSGDEKVAGVSKNGLHNSLQRLVREGILVGEVSQGRYRFAHDLLYQAARRLNTPPQARAIAQMVEQVYRIRLQDRFSAAIAGNSEVKPFTLDGATETVPLLAHCYQPSGRLWRSLGYSLLAADYFQKANASDRAIEWYEEALRLVRQGENPKISVNFMKDPEDRQLLTAKGWLSLARFIAYDGLTRLYRKTGLYDRLIATCREAEKIAENYFRLTISDERIGEMYRIWMEALDQRAQLNQAVKLSNAPLLSRLEGQAATRTFLHFCVVLYRQGRTKNIRLLAEKLRGQAEANADEASMVKAYNLYSIYGKYTGALEMAAEYAEKSLKIVETWSDNSNQLYNVWINLAFIYQDSGDKNNAYHYVARLKRGVEKKLIEDAGIQREALHRIGEYYREYGQTQPDFCEAERYYQLACQLAEEHGESFVEFNAVTLFCLASLYAEQGDLERAEPYMEQARKVLEEADYRMQYPEFYRFYARYFELKKDLTSALTYYLEAAKWAAQVEYLVELVKSGEQLIAAYPASLPYLPQLEKYLRKGWSVHKELGDSPVIRWLAELLLKLYQCQLNETTELMGQKRLKRQVATWQKYLGDRQLELTPSF